MIRPQVTPSSFVHLSLDELEAEIAGGRRAGRPLAVAETPEPRWNPRGFALDEAVGAVYLYAVQNGGISPSLDVAADLDLSVRVLEESTARLVDMHLLRPDVTDRRRFTPLNPDVAAASLISPLEGEIQHRRELIATIRTQMSDLLPRYQDARPRPATTAELRSLGDQAEVAGSLHLVVNECGNEVTSIRAHGTVIDDLPPAEALVRDIALLRKGVRLRLVYPHASRADFTTRSYLKQVVAEGAEVRTTNHLPGQFVIFDRKLVFTANADGALEVSNPALAELMCGIFECVWDTAQPYSTTDSGYVGVSDQILRDITKLLAEGLTDEVIARRLGMSLRACRRHIARLLRDLDSVSRFQAGTRAAEVGLIDAGPTGARGCACTGA